MEPPAAPMASDYRGHSKPATREAAAKVWWIARGTGESLPARLDVDGNIPKIASSRPAVRARQSHADSQELVAGVGGVRAAAAVGHFAGRVFI